MAIKNITNNKVSEISLIERFGLAFVSGFLGAVIGLVPALVVIAVDIPDVAPIRAIQVTAVAFAVVGFFWYSFVFETLLGLMHFVWSFLNTAALSSDFEVDHNLPWWLRIAAWLGAIASVICLIFLYL